MSFWFKFFQDEHARALVRKARARAIWPWVLCRISDRDGEALESDLDPWRIAEDHDHVVTESQAAEMIARLKSEGALVWTGVGWTGHDWPDRKADPTAAARKAAQREREKAALAGGDGHKSHSDMRDKRDVTAVTADQKRSEEKRPYDPPTGGEQVNPVGGAPAGGSRAPLEKKKREPKAKPIEDERVSEVFAHWVTTFIKTGVAADPNATESGKDRVKLIADRLAEGYTVEILKRAIDGCAKSKYHIEGGYMDLTLIMRSADKVDAFEAKALATTRRDPAAMPSILPVSAPIASEFANDLPPCPACDGAGCAAWGREPESWACLGGERGPLSADAADRLAADVFDRLNEFSGPSLRAAAK